ncbi:NUDIX hydrolase [Pseudomonas sp. No.117]
MTRTLHIAAAILLNERQQMLLVRKRGTTAYMQPGGKVDSGEQPLEALIRELEEELGLVVAPADATFLGQYQAPAANEPGFTVDCALYQVALPATGQATAAAEIEEALWVSVLEPSDLELAPLTRDLIFPLLAQRICPSSAPR